MTIEDWRKLNPARRNRPLNSLTTDLSNRIAKVYKNSERKSNEALDAMFKSMKLGTHKVQIILYDVSYHNSKRPAYVNLSCF